MLCPCDQLQKWGLKWSWFFYFVMSMFVYIIIFLSLIPWLCNRRCIDFRVFKYFLLYIIVFKLKSKRRVNVPEGLYLFWQKGKHILNCVQDSCIILGDVWPCYCIYLEIKYDLRRYIWIMLTCVYHGFSYLFNIILNVTVKMFLNKINIQIE